MRRRWSTSATADAVPQLRSAVTAFAAEAGLNDAPLSDVRLAVTEAVTNAVQHSYRDDPDPGPVDVAAELRGGELRIVVADEGQGLSPRANSPGLGMGLAIIAAVTDAFDLRPGARRGTECHMSFRLQAP